MWKFPFFPKFNFILSSFCFFNGFAAIAGTVAPCEQRTQTRHTSEFVIYFIIFYFSLSGLQQNESNKYILLPIDSSAMRQKFREQPSSWPNQWSDRNRDWTIWKKKIVCVFRSEWWIFRNTWPLSTQRQKDRKDRRNKRKKSTTKTKNESK